MKWKYKYEKNFSGKERTITKFLWWPKYIDGTAKWLETVKIFQRYSANYAESGWEDIRWV